jgi:hypothetical protein
MSDGLVVVLLTGTDVNSGGLEADSLEVTHG